MKKKSVITHLFLDIGGVLLTNGWDHHARKRAAAHFKVKFADMEERHRSVFEIYETGKISLEEYLNLVIFYQKRSFSRAQFQRFIFAQSKAFPEMIHLAYQLKILHGLKIAVINNESRELNEYRIRKFKLDKLVDCFISSSFVHIRKPEVEIFRLALDITQAKPQQVVYIENTPMFVQIAESLGIRSILHTNYKSTCEKLASLGLYHQEDTDD